MALHQLLQLGVQQALIDNGSSLDSWVAERGLDGEVASHLRLAFEAMPGLLLAIDGALYSEGVPGHARTVFNAVVRYLLLEDDLVPARDEDRLTGHLDDLYLLHRAAQELRDHIDGVDFRSIDGGAELLASVLPDSVTVELDARLRRAMASE